MLVNLMRGARWHCAGVLTRYPGVLVNLKRVLANRKRAGVRVRWETVFASLPGKHPVKRVPEREGYVRLDP